MRECGQDPISIHAPRTGSDNRWASLSVGVSVFQSTLPARGATSEVSREITSSKFQSTLPARGATQRAAAEGIGIQFQSTLPARGATYLKGVINGRAKIYFNPRSPHGERQEAQRPCGARTDISIHAPRTGSDKLLRHRSAQGDISIHAPRTGSDH